MSDVRLKDIFIIDSPTGSGKTSAMKEYVKENPKLKFIYITPYLTEVSTLAEKMGFYEPKADDNKNKSQALIPLLHNGKNIICSHQLFFRLDDYHRKLIAEQGYELIVDEVPEGLMEVISDPSRKNKPDSDILDKITIADLEMLKSNDYIKIDNKNHLIVWNENLSEEYQGTFEKFRNTIRLKEIYLVNKSLIACVKPQNFLCFNNITFLTYRYKNSMLDFYLTYNDFAPYNKYKHIKSANGKYIIADGYREEYPKGLERIKLHDGKYNDFTKDEKEIKLSKRFFETCKKGSKNDEYLANLKNAAKNYVRNILQGDYKRLIWTTIDSVKNRLENRYLKIDYKKDGEIIECFKSCNYKASNEFRDRTAVAYICEINLNPNILHFLKIFGITVNQEAKNDFTLSIFLQFLWRSNIRDAKSTQSIDVYIPSPRLRELFAEWLERGLHNKQKIDQEERKMAIKNAEN